MSLKCLLCMSAADIAVRLDPKPYLVCRECKSELPVERARALLAELNATWEPVLKWLDAAPGDPKPGG